MLKKRTESYQEPSHDFVTKEMAKLSKNLVIMVK
jgi:hypothetical protein